MVVAKAPTASAVMMPCAILCSTPSLKTTLMFGERNKFGGRAVIVQETNSYHPDFADGHFAYFDISVHNTLQQGNLNRPL